MTVVLMALTGVVIFLIRDYFTYKDNTDTALKDNKEKIVEERTTRLGNLKYVVENVNDINNKIYTAYATSSNQMTSNIRDLSSNQARIIDGIDAFAKFDSAVGNTGNNISLLNLPGAVAPDVRLIKHVTMMSGLNINQIGSNLNSNVMFCNNDSTTPRCIKIPDSAGNTVLTSLYAGKRVVLDSESDINGTLNFNEVIGTGTATKYADIKAVGTNLNISSVNNMFLNSAGGKVGVGTTSFTTAATLHVNSLDNTQSAFRVTCPGNNEVSVDKDGVLYVKEIRFGNESSGDTLPKISSDTNGNLTLSLNGTTSRFTLPSISRVTYQQESGAAATISSAGPPQPNP